MRVIYRFRQCQNLVVLPRLKASIVKQIAFYFLFFIPFFSIAQTRIELLNANTLEYDEELGKAKRLLGNVSFKHESAILYCDSAYLYPENALDAFGNVHIQQGDTLNLFGQFLKYNGNTKKAELTKDVKLIDKDITLTSNFLNYDLSNDLAYYTGSGKIISKDNTLTSENGYYYAKSKDFYFKRNVKLVNPEYIVNCDTLRYNTLSEIAYFLSPTTIVSKENTIYCENGWYDTRKNIAQFNKNARLNNPKQQLRGDSLYYNRNKGYGKAIQNIEVRDTSENIIITGDLGEYFENDDNSIVTGHALLIQIYATDSLFLHADLLRATTDSALALQGKVRPVPVKSNPKTKNKNTVVVKDTLSKQESQAKRVLLAYKKVKFFKSDMQGKCDSLVFTYKDSTMRLFTDPVIWSDKNQLTSDSINIHTFDGKMQSMDLKSNAFISSQEDSTRYNQIKGKSMKGLFHNNELSRINVNGNGQTIYYAKDKEAMIGVNKTDCSSMIILVRENKIDRITFITKPDATMFPIEELSPKDLLLRDFKWWGKLRPLSKMDVFN
jgi:lipopolysaccharide export system protein LptA